MGELLPEMLRIEPLSIEWVCEQCEKTRVYAEKLVRETLPTLWKSAGTESVKANVNDSDQCLVGFLGADAWKSILNEVV